MARSKTEKQEKLLNEYRVLRNRANTRLRALEKLAQNPEYENVLKYAYRVAERDIKELGIGDVTKVRFKTPTNTNKLEAAIRRVEKFLDSPTSTKTNIDKVYSESAKNLNVKFGTNFTWQEMKIYLDSINWDEKKKEVGSDRLIAAIRTLKSNKITSEDIKAANEKYKIIADDDSVEADWTKTLIEQGLNPDMLFEGTGENPLEGLEDVFID